MHRFLMDGPLAPGAFVRLTTEEAKHAQRVLRLAEGEAVELFNGRGAVHTAVLEAVGTGGVLARVGSTLPDAEPKARVTLYQGIAKGEKMDWIVQKCTELGVARIRPVRFARCVAQAGRPERWQRIALEAAKQCGRGWIPLVEEPMAFSALMDTVADHGQCLIPWEEAREGGLSDVLDRSQSDLALVVGPEGGLEAGEVEALRQRGARSITLGPRILRTETAAMAVLTMTLYAMGELGCRP